MLFIGLIFTEKLKGLAQDHTTSQGQCPFLMAQWRKGKKVGVEVDKCYQRQSTVAFSRFLKCLRGGIPAINSSCLRTIEVPNTIVLILSFHPPPPCPTHVFLLQMLHCSFSPSHQPSLCLFLFPPSTLFWKSWLMQKPREKKNRYRDINITILLQREIDAFIYMQLWTKKGTL